MKDKILFVIFCFIVNFTYSQTNVSGGLFSNTVWTASGSPYLVTADVALYPGNTLTIEPGVLVKFNAGTKLILRGALNAIGSLGNEIVFTSSSNNPAKGNWLGIEIENNQGGQIIASHLIGEYAESFIRILNSSNGEVLNMNNSVIKNCDFAFYGYDGQSNHTVVLDKLHAYSNTYGYIYAQGVTLSNSIFSDGEKGIHCWASPANMYISNSEFYNFSIWPFNMSGEIDNCHIHDNVVGIRIKPNLTVKNSIIENNLIGVEVLSIAQFSGENIYNNEICNNVQYNLKHFYSYPISIPNNCWCSPIESEISQTIFDANDDVSLGIVSFKPFFTDCTVPLSTASIFNTKNEISIYPNPAINEISISGFLGVEYEIYSSNGVVVKQGVVNREMNVSELNPGLYLLKIVGINQLEFSVFKFIKK